MWFVQNNYSLNRQHLVIFLEALEMAGPEFTEYDLWLIDCDWFCWSVALGAYDTSFCIREVFDVMYVKLKGWLSDSLYVYNEQFSCSGTSLRWLPEWLI